jgi:integrase
MANKSKKKSNYRQFGSVKVLESGKFQASYKRNVGGKTKTFYGPQAFNTKTEANNWLTMEANLVLTNKWTVPGDANPINTEVPTFGVYAARHIKLQTNSKGVHLKPSTAEKYESYISKYLVDFEDLPITSITKSMVDEWWLKATSTGKLTTASKAYKFMHSVFERAVNDEWLGDRSNPCQVKGAQNASTGRATYTPTMEEVVAVANAIKPQYRVLVLLTAYAALRFGEVTALKRENFISQEVDGKRRWKIEVVEAVTYVKKQFFVGTPKNAKGAGSVVITSAMTDIIGGHLEGMISKDSDALVFEAPGGGYLRNDVFAKALKSAVKKAGLAGKDITPHSLRRAGGTEYGNSGANLTEVKDFIRDASTNAALRYVQSTNRTILLAESMSAPFEGYEPPLD